MSQQFGGMSLNGGGSPSGPKVKNNAGPEIIDVGPSSKSKDYRGGSSGSNVEGFIVRRLPPPSGEKSTWQRCSRARMPVTMEELEREVREQQRKGPSVSKAIENLKPNMQAQVLQIAEDQNKRDPDPRARWNVVSLRMEKKQKGTGFGGVQETMAMRVIVKRTLDDTAVKVKGPSGSFGAQQQGMHPSQGMQGMGGPSMPKGPQVRPDQPMQFNNGPPPFNGRDPRDMPGMPINGRDPRDVPGMPMNGGMRPDMGMPPQPHGPPPGFNPRDQPPPPPMHPMGGGGGGGMPRGPGGFPGGDPAMVMRGGPGGPGGPMGPGMAGSGGPMPPPNRNFPPQGPPPPPMPPAMHPGPPPMHPMRPPIAVPVHHGGPPEPVVFSVGKGPMPKRSNSGMRKNGGPRRSPDIVEVIDYDGDSSYSEDSYNESDLESRSTMPSSPGSHRAKLVGTPRVKQLSSKRVKPQQQHHRRHNSSFSAKLGHGSGGLPSPDHIRRERRRSVVEQLEDEEMLKSLRRRPSIGRDFAGIRRSGSLKEQFVGGRRSVDDHFDEPLSPVEVRIEAKRRRERAADRERVVERERERLVERQREQERMLERERERQREHERLLERERERRIEDEILRQEAHEEIIREDALREEEERQREEELRREIIREEAKREAARRRGAATARGEERYDRLRRTATDPYGDDLRAPPPRSPLRSRGFRGLF